MTTDELSDAQAVRVLALVLDHADTLPDPEQLRVIEARVREAARDPLLAAGYAEPGSASSQGELVRAILRHLISTRPELQRVVQQARDISDDAAHFELATVGVGGLVLVALHSDLELSRPAAGKWHFRLRRKATKDSTLAAVLSNLVGLYRAPEG
ncbi:MAG: hypothetical protein ACRDSP_09430 [Pseudonocardiaceae bacterium]